jgi:hypothetical protein
MIYTCLRQPPKLYILDGGKYKKQDGFHFRESSLRFAKKELEELHKIEALSNNSMKSQAV